MSSNFKSKDFISGNALVFISYRVSSQSVEIKVCNKNFWMDLDISLANALFNIVYYIFTPSLKIWWYTIFILKYIFYA